jgi:hypothetical protein
MGMQRLRNRLIPGLAVWVLLLAAPGLVSAAAAESRTFLNTDPEFPTGDANGLIGPAPHYPSTIAVSGVAGTVTKVTATVIGLGSASPDDIDMALVGPDGAQVMLMSDACGQNPSTLSEATWTFDDAAPSFLSDNGPCTGQVGTFKPSNYENPELDDLSKEAGGPPPPYTNALSALAGGSPDGTWKLFVLDDSDDFVGFTFDAWALTLEIEPPPPPTPTIQTVEVPGPTITLPALAPTPGPGVPSTKTGKRAAALTKCKAKKTKVKRAACRKKAQKLPV